MTPEQWQRSIEKRKRAFFRERTDLSRAFEFSKQYSSQYRNLITTHAAQVSRSIFGTDIPPGVAIFSFGAPSRNEMMGNSDADVAVYRSGKSPRELQFREQLIASLAPYGFTKIDTPEWGTGADIERYITTSVTEANQVIEAQFICGDQEWKEQVEAARANLFSKENCARNLLFQFFYFNQYFDRKKSNNHLNLKYCHGGTRDMLFPTWYAHLKYGVEPELGNSAIERGLQALANDGLLTPTEAQDIQSAASAIAFIRDELLAATPKDADGKLSPESAARLHEKWTNMFTKPEEIIQVIEKSRPCVQHAKDTTRTGLCDYLLTTHSEDWGTYFQRSLLGEQPDLPPELKHDEIINTVRLWNITGQTAEREAYQFREAALSNSWIILASALSNPYIPGENIDSIVRTKGVERGYEYLLEIAARNPNLTTATLNFIINDAPTESRFKKPAEKRALERTHGKDCLF